MTAPNAQREDANVAAERETTKRDHGGGVDAARARWGGTRAEWIDLSTGINPVPYSVADLPADAWTALPDAKAASALEAAARSLWQVPEHASILAAPGASALISRLPALWPKAAVSIPGPTYNEHAAAFAAHGWEASAQATTQVAVHPNNPDGRLWTAAQITAQNAIIDESFCDITPDASLIHLATEPNRIILKSFGKFWGLAGLRLGFAIGPEALIEQLRTWLGPWPVSGPALAIGAKALRDHDWATKTRARLATDSARLDALMLAKGAALTGGTPLFRLYEVDDAAQWQTRLAEQKIWTRIFPWSPTHIRLGLPAPAQWPRIEAAI